MGGTMEVGYCRAVGDSLLDFPSFWRCSFPVNDFLSFLQCPIFNYLLFQPDPRRLAVIRRMSILSAK
jgi:hypothetical protein